MTTFATLLRRYRDRAGLSCNETGRAIGVDPSYISRLERQEREPPRRRLVERLGEALALSVAETETLLLAAGYAPEGMAERLAWAEAQLARWEAWHAEMTRTAPLLLGPLPGVAPYEERQAG